MAKVDEVKSEKQKAKINREQKCFHITDGSTNPWTGQECMT